MAEILNAENLKMGMNSGIWAGVLDSNGLLGWDMILTLKRLRCFCNLKDWEGHFHNLLLTQKQKKLEK